MKKTLLIAASIVLLLALGVLVLFIGLNAGNDPESEINLSNNTGLNLIMEGERKQ